MSAWIQGLQKTQKHFSFRELSRKAGVRSPNYFQQVLRGDKNLGFEGGHKVAELMKLDSLQKNYFLSLVGFQTAKNHSDKQKSYEELLKLRKKASQERDVSFPLSNYDYLKNWLYVAVREFLVIYPRVMDPAQIAAHIGFGVNVDQVSQALSFLEGAGLLQKKSDAYVIIEKKLGSSDEIDNLAVREFHLQIQELGQKALNELSLEDREFGALTLGLSVEQIQKLKNRIKEFRKSLLAEFGQAEHHAKVFQVCISAFPLSSRLGDSPTKMKSKKVSNSKPTSQIKEKECIL